MNIIYYGISYFAQSIFPNMPVPCDSGVLVFIEERASRVLSLP